MPRIAGHLQAEELELYCLGGLDEIRCARAEEHLFLCEICRDRLTETEDYIAGMRQAGRQWSAGHTEDPPVTPIAIHSWTGSWVGRLTPVLIAATMVFAALWLGHRSNWKPQLPFAVGLTALRGSAPGSAPAGRPLLLQLDLTGLGEGQPFAGEVVDASGSRVAKFPVAASALLHPLAPGGYFVRIYRNSGELLREYALTVRR